jgi:hypothetical protein
VLDAVWLPNNKDVAAARLQDARACLGDTGSNYSLQVPPADAVATLRSLFPRIPGSTSI